MHRACGTGAAGCAADRGRSALGREVDRLSVQPVEARAVVVVEEAARSVPEGVESISRRSGRRARAPRIAPQAWRVDPRGPLGRVAAAGVEAHAAGRPPRRVGALGRAVGQPGQAAPVGGDRVDLLGLVPDAAARGQVAVAAEEDPRAVGRPAGVGVVALVVGQPPLVAAVGRGGVDLARVPALVRRADRLVAVADAGERQPAAVRRPGRRLRVPDDRSSAARRRPGSSGSREGCRCGPRCRCASGCTRSSRRPATSPARSRRPSAGTGSRRRARAPTRSPGRGRRSPSGSGRR